MRFFNCKIDLSKRIFKPRIETEYWIKQALSKLQIENCRLQIEKKLKILDIFAGSGCIGIAVLKNIKNVRMDFIDIDKNAIEQIKINLKLNRISQKRYRVIRSNMFEKLRGNKYDFIFANPPYVAKNRISEVQKQVLKTDPKIALFAGKDGMLYIKKFLKQVKNHLKKDGLFFLEFDPLQKLEIEKILKKENLQFKFYKDQFKKWRWVDASNADVAFR